MSKQNKDLPVERHKESLSNQCSSTVESEKTSKSARAEEMEDNSVCASSSRSSSANNIKRGSSRNMSTDDELRRITETELVISQQH
jgi:hypothetical protein